MEAALQTNKGIFEIAPMGFPKRNPHPTLGKSFESEPQFARKTTKLKSRQPFHIRTEIWTSVIRPVDLIWDNKLF